MAKTSDIVWHDHSVDREARERHLGQRGVVVWFTGLSGCGKSTIANVLDQHCAIFGAIAGFAGGWSDMLLMRIMDIVLSFPALILAIAIVTVLGIGLVNSVAAVVIVSIPLYARLTRSAISALGNLAFFRPNERFPSTVICG